jgi:hypothetical protein
MIGQSALIIFTGRCSERAIVTVAFVVVVVGIVILSTGCFDPVTNPSPHGAMRPGLFVIIRPTHHNRPYFLACPGPRPPL